MPKLVYIAHQIAGNVDENVKEVLRICRDVHTPEIVPLAPYLVAVQYLDDALERERKLGIAANLEHFRRKLMDETWLCGPRISNGMKSEIQLSLQYGIPVKCHNPALRLELEEIIEQYNAGQNHK